MSSRTDLLRQEWSGNNLDVGTHEGTSPRNLLQGQVPSYELAIFATKSSRRDQTVRGTSPCDQSLRVNSTGD